MRDTPPYSALAAGYDLVMAHVDYPEWAEYVLDLLDEHAPEAASILELGCGTGSLGFELQRLGEAFTGQPGGFRYLGTDASEPMIRVARAKARSAGRIAGRLPFAVADFTDYTVEEPFDVALLLFDGINYLLDAEQIEATLRATAEAVVPGGLFILDQSTPANSLNNAEYFQDEGEADAFKYVRRSHYDPESRLHTTEFDLTVLGEDTHEAHVQRAYERAEIEALIEASPFEIVAAYDGFEMDPATDESERIHWVLRRP